MKIIKNAIKKIARRFTILDGKIGIEYRSNYTYDSSRKAEIQITYEYKILVIGFEKCFYGVSKQFIEGIRINSYCLFGIHASFLDAYESVIETVDGRILNAANRVLIKRKEFA